MKGPPAFSFYPKDYESDEHVKLMSLEQEGAYIRLLCHSWLHGSIPDEVPALARICRTTPSRMSRLWPGILPCWKPSPDGRLVNGRLERQREKQAAWSQVQSEKGRRGAVKRWQEPLNKDSSGHSPAIAQAQPPDSFPFPSPFPSPSERQTERAGRQSAPANPLLRPGDRPARESEGYRLVRLIGRFRDRYPEDVLGDAAHYEGAQRRKARLDSMTDDRLLNTLSDLRAEWEDCQKHDASRAAQLEREDATSQQSITQTSP